VRRLSPENPAGYASGGAALHALGREDQAEQLLVFAQDRFPESAETAIQYAWVAHHRHDWDEAARRWRAVRARFPDNGWGYAAGGRALLEAGDVDAAQTVLAEGLVRLPDNPGVREAWEKCEQRRISA
jgi:predicted Zn-dependent protease